MNQENQDRIDKYVTGKMTEEERTSFEHEMKNDPQLRQQAEFTRTVSKSIKNRNEKLEMMKGFEREYENNYEGRKKSNDSSHGKFKFIYWASSIAAVLVVGFFIMKSVNNSSENMTFPIELAVESGRGGGNELNELKQLIENDKCEEALKRIDKHLESNKDYLLELKNDTTIENDEKEYKTAGINEENEHLKWLKAHALIRLGKKDGAKTLLNEIRSRDGQYKEKANELYNKIK